MSNLVGCSAGTRPIRSPVNSIAASGRGPGLAACGWSMPICSRVTAWTSGSKVGDARTPSSCAESTGDGCQGCCSIAGMPRRQRSGSNGIGVCSGWHSEAVDPRTPHLAIDITASGENTMCEEGNSRGEAVRQVQLCRFNQHRTSVIRSTEHYSATNLRSSI